LVGYAGIVEHNSIRAFGLKFELFKYQGSLSGKEEMVKLQGELFSSIKLLIQEQRKSGWWHKRNFRCHGKQVTVDNYLSKIIQPFILNWCGL
jgi:hypothetical protein